MLADLPNPSSTARRNLTGGPMWSGIIVIPPNFVFKLAVQAASGIGQSSRTGSEVEFPIR
jgi:hypothetical protein